LAWTACGERQDEASDHRLSGPRNFVSGYPPLNADGSVNAVIEIPAGTTAKWETLHDGSAIEWEAEAGGRRVVRYLPYPGNYGMVPGTLLPQGAGGDGDPLDIIVLGDAPPRGSVVAVRLVGVLRLLDDEEQDDKLVAVVPKGPLGDVRDLDDLEQSYPGVAEILEIWFTGYKGPGRIESLGYEKAPAAERILRDAAEAYRAPEAGEAP
jgi:inorganic pyrophosphatase